MDTLNPGSTFDDEHTDKCAIMMMLAYVEAECRRLGVEAAADHAALAASLLTPPEAAGTPAGKPLTVSAPPPAVH